MREKGSSLLARGKAAAVAAASLFLHEWQIFPPTAVPEEGGQATKSPGRRRRRRVFALCKGEGEARGREIHYRP